MSKFVRPVLNRYPVLVLGGMILVACHFCSIAMFGQNDAPQPVRSSDRTDKEEQTSPSIGEMIVKQQISRRKKDHDELLKRGEDVLKLSEELETSFAENETLSELDISKLETLEKAVSKIRSDLGGDDNDDDEMYRDENSRKETAARQNIASAFRFLQESTKKLVDELKRTSRFSISAAAIQTSNAVIRFARFLRLKH